jgi:hypothetical protein
MNLQGVLATTVFLVGIGSLIRGNVLFGEIVADIKRLEPKNQPNLYGFERHRFFDVLADYRRLYPEGRLGGFKVQVQQVMFRLYLTSV